MRAAWAMKQGTAEIPASLRRARIGLSVGVPDYFRSQRFGSTALHTEAYSASRLPHETECKTAAPARACALGQKLAYCHKASRPDSLTMRIQSDFRRLVESTGLSKDDLAEFLGCDLSTLYRWIREAPPPGKPVVEAVRQLAASRRAPQTQGAPTFRFIDLFAGIGGMRLGVEAAGGECVFTSEWNTHSRTTYQRNFPDGPEHPFKGDITLVSPDQIPSHDLLVAGFPCQPFSIAGVSKKNALGKPHGFQCQEQGNLFFEIYKILAAHKPAGFILENVKNLKSHDGGTTFAVIEHYLRDKLGYFVDSRVINAKAFVPQNRERIFIVGLRRDVGMRLEDIPLPDADWVASYGPRLRDILHSENGAEEAEEPYTTGPKAEVSPKYVLSAHLWKYLRDYAAKHRMNGNGFGFGLVDETQTARTLSARYFKDGSEILINRGARKRPRRLTPRECARLMGFDRPSRKRFEIPVSDTQAYKQFGNAVVVPVVESVARHLVPYLQQLIEPVEPSRRSTGRAASA